MVCRHNYPGTNRYWEYETTFLKFFIRCKICGKIRFRKKNDIIYKGVVMPKGNEYGTS